MAARLHDDRSHGGGFLALVLGALAVAALGVAWMAWSGGLFEPDPSRLELNLKIPEPQNLPSPTPAPNPQPVPLPGPVTPPR